MDDSILIQLYSEQPKSAEKLANTDELTRLASFYRVMTKQTDVHDAAILARLLYLRKAGKLPRKTNRAIHVPKPDTWGALESGSYKITMVHEVGFWNIVQAVCKSGGMLPVSRAETLKMVHRYYDGFVHLVQLDGEVVEERIKQLFPELWV